MFDCRKANGNDVPNIVKLAQDCFQQEIDTIFTPDPVAYSRNITLAIVRSFYMPYDENVCVYVNNNDLLAYSWINRETSAWSDDNMAVVKMAHINLQLPTLTKVKILLDMLSVWEAFAYHAKIPIICSTTMRRDQDTFLKIHKKCGYDVRGSFAYKRIDTTQATPAN